MPLGSTDARGAIEQRPCQRAFPREEAAVVRARWGNLTGVPEFPIAAAARAGRGHGSPAIGAAR